MPSLPPVLAVSTYSVPVKALEPFSTRVPCEDLVRLFAPLMLLEIVRVTPLSTIRVELAVRVMPALPSVKAALATASSEPPPSVIWLAVKLAGLPSVASLMRNVPALIVVRPVKLFEALRVQMPAPPLVSPPVPKVSGPARVPSAALSPFKVRL